MDQGNGTGPELGDLDFQYADTDTLEVELAELYSYTEQQEFQVNAEKFAQFSRGWSRNTKVIIIRRLLDAVESVDQSLRLDAVQAMLYVAQGTWAEENIKQLGIQKNADCIVSEIQENCKILYRLGAWPTLLQLLRLEADKPPAQANSICVQDSRRLREILTIMCTIVEVFRRIDDSCSQEEIVLRATFREELSQGNGTCGISGENEIFGVTLMQMITAFCNGSSPHYPVKKLLIMLWKTLLFTLGGIDELKRLRALAREKEGLPPGPPDTTDVVRTMRPASPPATLVDMIEVQQQRKSLRMQFKRQTLVKQSSMDDQEAANNVENQLDPTDIAESAPAPKPVLPDEQSVKKTPAGEPQVAHSESLEKVVKKEEKEKRGLPWQPKAALRDIDNFLAQARMKFVGYQLPNDTTTLAGLPDPIHKGLRILEKHKYTPLREVQIMKEMKIERHPFTHEIELDDTAIERLYQALLPHMCQHMISLLKILLAAAPTSKAKTESVNILADLLPTPEATVDNCLTPVQSQLLAADINRHKEILVKSISAILLLLVKHVKISHCLQFEYLAQQLMFANCIPLVLKFFNQNVISYAAARHSLLAFEFPKIVLDKPNDLTSEMLEGGTERAGQLYCWRNVFACINLLRILNKLTKNKHSRVMMLVVFKSAPILKRALKVRQAMLQLYALKLLKTQTKYLGRQWRKTNMKTISAIYQKVRHRLGDDWAYGGDLDARPWDFQSEEFSLQVAITDYHKRRYDRLPGNHNNTQQSTEPDPLLDLDPVDNCFLSVLGRQFELLQDFKENYSYWLKYQVYDTSIEWEKLLESPQF